MLDNCDEVVRLEDDEDVYVGDPVGEELTISVWEEVVTEL